MATKSRYVANVPILHNGTRFAIGDPLALTVSEAASMGSAVTAQAGALPAMPADPLVPAMIPAGATALSVTTSAQVDGYGNRGVAFPAIQRGATTVLLGDSLMLNLLNPANPQAFTYDPATGIASAQYNSHGFYPGQALQLAVKGRPDFCVFDIPAGRVDANNLSLQLPTGLSNAPSTLSEIWVASQGFRRSDYPYSWLRCRKPKLLRVCGVVSETAAQIRARLSHALELMPSVIELRAGTNDRAITSVDAVYADILYMVQQATSLGINVILHTVPPSGAPTAAQSVWTVALNRLLMAIPRMNPLVRICDDYAAMVDPASATGAALSGTLGSDNLHFVSKGAKRIAARLQDCYDSILQSVSAHPTSIIQAYEATNNPSGYDAWGNGLLSTATGGTASSNASGTAAASLVVKGTATMQVVASVVAAAVGNAQRVVGTPTAANDQMIVQTASLHARVAAGERRRFQCHIKTSGVPANAAVKNISVLVQIAVDGVTYSQLRSLYTPISTSASFPQEDLDMDVETDPILIPSGSITSVQAQAQIDFAGAGSAVTFEVSQIGFPIEP